MNRLENKVAIVTGSTAGIGRAVAEEFARQGAKVVVSGRNAERGNAVVEDIKNEGGEAVFVASDISSEESLKNLVDQALATYGKLDVLVNNAAMGFSKPLLETTSEEWDQVMAADLKSVFLLTKFAMPKLLETKGSIINFSSASMYKPMPREHAYTSAKAAILTLTKTVAAEFAAEGVRVNAILPGLIKTSILDAYSEEGIKRVEQAIPLKRIGQPEDIAMMAVFLASDESSYVTGHEFIVDGGVTM